MASRPRKVSQISRAFVPTSILLDFAELTTILLIASLLSTMQVPEGYTGPSLQVMSRNLKQEEVPVFVRRVMAEVPQDVQKVAVFQNDKFDGELSQKVFDGFQERGTEMVEMSDFFADVQKVKLAGEQQNMQMAANLTTWTFEKIVQEIEDIIEEDKKVKHSYIQSKIESSLDKDEDIG